MHYVEQRQHPKAAHSLASDLVRHLYARDSRGKVIVIANEPFWLMRVARKEWLRLTKMVERERSKTLNLGRIHWLHHKLGQMEQTAFSIKPLAQKADVVFVRPSDANSLTGKCHTAYIVDEISSECTNHLKKVVQYHGLLVIYKAHDA